MADPVPTSVEPDPVLAGLKALLDEFKSHKARLKLRSSELRTQLADGKLTEAAALGKVAIELFDELHDTALSFQEDLARNVYVAFAEAGDDGAEDDEDDEGEPDDDEIDSLLLPGDAAALKGVVSSHIELLANMIDNAQSAGVTTDQLKQLKKLRSEADAAQSLIDEITLVEGESAESDDDAEEADAADDDAPADDAPN